MLKLKGKPLNRVKTIWERIEDLKEARKAILKRHKDDEDAVYDSDEAHDYHKIKNKLRKYQVMASKSVKLDCSGGCGRAIGVRRNEGSQQMFTCGECTTKLRNKREEKDRRYIKVRGHCRGNCGKVRAMKILEGARSDFICKACEDKEKKKP